MNFDLWCRLLLFWYLNSTLCTVVVAILVFVFLLRLFAALFLSLLLPPRPRDVSTQDPTKTARKVKLFCILSY